MKKEKYNNRKGFTMIELLVVVLIIGILAGIALPQYRGIMDKAKITKYRALIDDIIKLQGSYYYVNETYPVSLKQLDIVMPHFCSKFAGSNNILVCNDATIRNNSNPSTGTDAIALTIVYCPNINILTYDECQANRIFEAKYRYPNAKGSSGQRNGTWACSSYSDRGKKLISLFCPK